MNNVTTPETMISALNGGLGVLTWWDLDNTHITPARLRMILTQAGEDPSIVPDMNPRTEVKRAGREFTRGRGRSDRFKTVVSYEGDDEIRIELLRLETVGSRSKGFLPVFAWTFDVQANQPVITRLSGVDGLPAQVLEAIDAFEANALRTMTHLDHSWLRPAFIQARIMSWAAFSLRRQGGVYYVPTQFQAALENLAGIVRQIGDSALHIAHVEATEASRESLSTSARISVESELSDLRGKLDSWLADSHSVRPATLADALVAYEEIRNRANLYAETLGMLRDDIIAETAEAREVVQDLLGQRQAELSVGHSVPARTVVKLGKAIAAADMETPTHNHAVLTSAICEAHGLGVSMFNNRGKWVEGGVYYTAALKAGWTVVASDTERVVLHRD